VRKVIMEMLLDVCQVRALPDYILSLEFENGESRIFDMKPLLASKPFDRLKDVRLFQRAGVGYGTVVWPGSIDIAPETLYLESIPAGNDASTTNLSAVG
jgi:hypothetical protein